jgi:predicted SprT family Zn-dependent metalloprotease
MKPYRKPDEEYYDRYDRFTIKWVKEIELEEAKGYPKKVMVDGKERIFLEPLRIKSHDRGVERFREREYTVKQWMQEDEEKDRMITQYKTPQGFKCDHCKAKLILSGHLFETFDEKILFVFDCPKEEHKSRKIVYPDGEVMYFPKPTCEKCGGKLICSSKRDKLKLITIDHCEDCGFEEIDEYDLTPDPPISEEDRKRYCSYHKGSNTVLEDIQQMADLWTRFEAEQKEKKEKQEYQVDKIDKLTIPKLKELLSKILKENKYSDFQFEKPDMGRFVQIEFSLQDPTSREKQESIKLIYKTINEKLLLTNWRLINSSVSYRLGYLTGKLKGYEDDESLLKLAKEISEQDKPKKK